MAGTLSKGVALKMDGAKILQLQSYPDLFGTPDQVD